MRNPISDSRKKLILPQLLSYYIDRLQSSPIARRFEPTSEHKILWKTKVGPLRLFAFQAPDSIVFVGGVQEGLPRAAFEPFSWGYLTLGPDRISDWYVQDKWNTYIKSSEQALSSLSQRLEKLLELAEEADPTESGEYTAWIVKQELTTDIRLPEDAEKVTEDLLSFIDRKKRNVIPKEFRDINKYQRYHQFFEMLKRYGGVLSDRESLRSALDQLTPLSTAGSYSVYEVSDWRVAKRLATGTNWCVRGTEMAKKYLRLPTSHPLYFFFKGEEPFALLTNLPEEQQFMDTKDVPITDTLLRKEKDLLELVGELAPWRYCSNCERTKDEREDAEQVATQHVKKYIEENRDTLFKDLIKAIGSRADVIGDIPSPRNSYQIIGDPELFKRVIMIGPVAVFRKISDARVPNIAEFVKKAGFSEREVFQSVLDSSRCSDCDSFKTEDSLALNVVKILFGLTRCEDYPCCGHEPLRMGAVGCPPSNLDGEFFGMRCVCGAYVPSSSSSSLCSVCLSEGSEPDDYDYFHHQDPDEDEEDVFEDDDCPVEVLLYTIKGIEKKWGKAAVAEWGIERDANGVIVKSEGSLPSWEKFIEVSEQLFRALKFLHQTKARSKLGSHVVAHLDTGERLFIDIVNQKYFDQPTFVQIVEFLKFLYTTLNPFDCCETK